MSGVSVAGVLGECVGCGNVIVLCESENGIDALLEARIDDIMRGRRCAEL
jgi:hypothetical protein